jgi:hypothetical protein
MPGDIHCLVVRKLRHMGLVDLIASIECVRLPDVCNSSLHI